MKVSNGTWNIETGDGAILRAHETVISIAGVGVHSRDNPCGIDAEGIGSLILAGAHARSVEGGDGAIGGAHEAVIDGAGGDVDSCDIPRRVHAQADGSVIRCCASAGSVEGGEVLSLRRGGRDNRQSKQNC